MSGTLEQGGRYTQSLTAKASLGVPELSFLRALMFSLGDKTPERQKGCSGVDGRGRDRRLQIGQEHSLPQSRLDLLQERVFLLSHML